MALDVFFQSDIRQGIVAVATASLSASAAHGATNVEYCRGILDFARSQALNRGILWSDIVSDLRLALTNAGHSDVIEGLMKQQLISR